MCWKLGEFLGVKQHMHIASHVYDRTTFKFRGVETDINFNIENNFVEFFFIVFES